MRLSERNLAFIVAILLFPFASSRADTPGFSNLNTVGPYAVGHVSYMLGNTTEYQRPVAVSIWYPVDVQKIDARTRLAEYALDPIRPTCR